LPRSIAEPLRASGVFPPMVVQMIHVGEQTGGLDTMLAKIADFYDDEVDAAVAALTSIIEPVLVIVMGIVIGGMVVAMYMPMFDMVQAVQAGERSLACYAGWRYSRCRPAQEPGMTTLDVTSWLGGERVLGRDIDSDLELDEAIAEGLPSGSLTALMQAADLSANDLAPIIPTRTLMAAKSRERLTPEQSDRLARLARLLSLAEETLGSKEKARAWMDRPNRALGGKRPLELARRSSGSLLVEQVLGRLAYGVYT
jgi:putative toxin-antitoxin system antitoxin component (TIGR02293 family)